MCKRLWKNAILALCVLALVLQPLICFASEDRINISDNLTYIKIDSFNNYSFVYETDHNYYISFMPYTSIDTSSTQQLSNLYDAFVSTLAQYGDTGFGTFNAISDGIFRFYRIPTISGVYSNQLRQLMGVAYRYSVSTGSFSNPVIVNQQASNASNPFYYTPNFNTAIVNLTYRNDDIEHTFIISTLDISLNENLILSYIEDIDNLVYYIFQDFILNNFLTWRTELNSWENIEWPSVGESLQYFMECAQNLNSSTVTLYRPQEMEIDPNSNGYVTRTNFLYGLTGNIEAILDKLNMAFPNNQAEMNDSIANQILDDTNDSGLTVNRITSAKSNLDHGLSTFKLDTSQSQYSNPFSALGDADWSFWSQTTLNNLGSGYSYSFSEGSLMSENDVFTENQNDLLNLLGW